MIPNTFSGFSSMTVRNTNMVTMSSFVVMIQCMFHEKRDSKCADYTELSNCQEATLIRSAPECRTPTDAQFTSCYAMPEQFNRPLSRRLDRCDRVIQDEVGDSNGGNV